MAQRAAGSRTGSARAADKRVRPPSIAARRTLFIELLRRTANVSRAAREAGLGNSTVYAHRARYPGFAAEWDAAIAEALDAVEEAVLARVRDGVEKPVFFGGKRIGAVPHYSDALAMFLLKSKRPEIYNRAASGPGTATPGVHDITDAEAEAEFDGRVALLAPREGG